MAQVLNANFVEHDAYILFDKLMTYGKSWYEFNDQVPSRPSQNKVKINSPSKNFLEFASNLFCRVD